MILQVFSILYVILFCIITYEFVHQGIRQRTRKEYYAMAKKRASYLGKPLVVIGDPENGSGSKVFGRTYDYGDYCLDLDGCPNNKNGNNIKGDIQDTLRYFNDDSAVVYVSCVLEYVDNIEKCISEIKRVGGNNIYVVYVSPYSLASYLYGSLIPSLGDNSRPKNVILSAPPYGEFKYRVL